MIFRQLFEHTSSTYTYLLADETAPGKPAVLIDPVDVTSQRDKQLIDELGVTLVYALNTHLHADHITGTYLLKWELPEVKSVIGAASGAQASSWGERPTLFASLHHPLDMHAERQDVRYCRPAFNVNVC